MNSSLFGLTLLSLLLVSASLLPSCMTANNHPAMEALNKFGKKYQLSDSPFVEAYVQYGSPPSDRWSGPQAVILHIEARKPGPARLELSPPLMDNTFAGLRKLAAQSQGQSEEMSSEVARAEMALLASRVIAAEESDGSSGDFYGCLYPVNVWLIQMDGSILERRTCRGAGQLDEVVSDTFSNLLRKKYYPEKIAKEEKKNSDEDVKRSLASEKTRASEKAAVPAAKSTATDEFGQPVK